MTDNLIERLRDWVPAEGPPEGRTAPDAVADMREAVDRIRALQAENAKLREALISMRSAAAGFALAVRNDSGVPYPWPALDIADAQAEAALQETER